MSKSKSKLSFAKRFAAAFALYASAIVSAHAGDWSYKVFDPPAAYQGQFDLRFWFGQGNTSKNLFDTTGSALVSRLTYSHFAIFTGEGVGRFDFNNSWFYKGYVGGGGLWSGKLKDEDFPPAIVPYSATTSSQKYGSLTYGAVDAGVNFARGAGFPHGLYAGYTLPARDGERHLAVDRSRPIRKSAAVAFPIS